MVDVALVNFFLHREPSKDPFAVVPLGPLYIAAALEEAGHEVVFLDYQLTDAQNPYMPETIAGFLGQTSAPTIGISVLSNMLPFLLEGLTHFKELSPDVHVVLGGSGVSGLGPAILAKFRQIDTIVAGEGERSMVDLLSAIAGTQNWSEVGGLVYRNTQDQVRSNPRARRGENIDALPRPAYHLLNGSRDRYIGNQILTARGCPFSCTFCDIAPNWSRQVTYRDLDAVLDEVEWLIETGNGGEISILDDVFALSFKRIEQFCDLVAERGLEFTWSCMCRVDLLGSRLMDKMYKAGCRRVFLGIESGSERVRDIAGKGLKIGNVEQMIAQCAERFDTRASFIMGFPFETLDEFHETAMLMALCLIRGASTQISILSPLPQAELTHQNLASLEFDPDLVSAMVFGRFKKDARSTTRAALTESHQVMIREDPVIFSAFYHFREGQVREKIKIAQSYGMKI